MKQRAYINKSKSGHYTVTIKKDKQVIDRFKKIGSLQEARKIAADNTLTAKQEELIEIIEKNQISSMHALTVKEAAIMLGTTPQSIGRMATSMYKKGVKIFSSNCCEEYTLTLIQ